METAQTQNQMADPQLIEAVRKQIEYYFSPENLQNDVFLTHQMDAHRSVPLSMVMNFAKLKALTQDEEVVRIALQDSQTVSIAENRIKMHVKPASRSTIILRDIPSSAAEESVREIFAFPGAKPLVSVRSDIGDTWFVSFETEQDAKDTLLDLKLQKRCFLGQPVKARVKTENVVRSYFPVHAHAPHAHAHAHAHLSVPPVYPMLPYAPPLGPLGVNMNMDMMGMNMPYGFVPMLPAAAAMDALALNDPNGALPAGVGAAPETAAQMEAMLQQQAQSTTNPVEAHAHNHKEGGEEKHNKRGGERDSTNARRSNTGGRANTTGSGARERERGPRNAEGRRTSTAEGRAPRGERGERRTASSSSSAAAAVVANAAPLEINAVTFPPLFAALDDTPQPTPGFKEAYTKYNLDEIIAIVKEVKEAALPAEVNAAAHSLAVTTEPNLDLLKRQRTFSIDETREQLRQGRPVLKDAILGGGVDMKSMMFGDNQHNAAAAAAAAVVSPAQETVTHEEKAVVAAPAATPTTRAKKSSSSSSSWAALVKSNADGAAAVVAAIAPAAAATRTPAKKNPAAPAATPTTKEKKRAEEKDANTAKKESKKKDENKEKKEGETVANAKTETDNATTAAAPVSSWGGKASFANMLKQNLTSEETAAASELPKKTAAVPASAPAPAQSNNNNNNKKNSHNTEKKDGAKREKKSEAEGRWVKEKDATSSAAAPEK